MPTSISLVISQLLFCHRYDDVNLVVVSSPSPFQIAVEKPNVFPRRVESGFQSGYDTQFLFTEADIRERHDADPSTVQLNAGKFVVPQSIKLFVNNTTIR